MRHAFGLQPRIVHLIRLLYTNVSMRRCREERRHTVTRLWHGKLQAVRQLRGFRLCRAACAPRVVCARASYASVCNSCSRVATTGQEQRTDDGDVPLVVGVRWARCRSRGVGGGSRSRMCGQVLGGCDVLLVLGLRERKASGGPKSARAHVVPPHLTVAAHAICAARVRLHLIRGKEILPARATAERQPRCRHNMTGQRKINAP